MGRTIMMCPMCQIQKGIDSPIIEVTVSVYSNKYNLKKEDGLYVYNDRVDEEGFEDLKSGDKTLYCQSCDTIGDF